MQFKALTLLTLAAVAAAAAVPRYAENNAIRVFTEECKKNNDQTVICCSKTTPKGNLKGKFNGADVTCTSVPSNVLAGMLSSIMGRGIGANGGYIGTFEQAQAQCDGGLGCCSNAVIEVSFLIFTFFSSV